MFFFKYSLPLILGNLTVVSELLRGGYRSIDAKNESGQTATHLAASLGNAVILKLLIQGGGNVNVKDDLDLTPLHVIQLLLIGLIIFYLVCCFLSLSCLVSFRSKKLQQLVSFQFLLSNLVFLKL